MSGDNLLKGERFASRSESLQEGEIVVVPKSQFTSKLNWVGIGTALIGIISFLTSESGADVLALIPEDYRARFLSALLTLSGIIVVIFRQYTNQPLKPITGGTVSVILALAVLLCAATSTVFAEDVMLTDVTLNKSGKTYIVITADANGKATKAEQIKAVVSVTGNPTVPVPPVIPPVTPTDPTQPTAFSREIEALTNKVLAAGGTKTTGAGISMVYAIVRDGVDNGDIKPDRAIDAISQATTAVLANQPDKDKWVSWRADVSKALQSLQVKGLLTTKEHYAAAFNQIVAGLNLSTGFNTAMLRGNTGILDGIDLAKIIELIRLIMDLLKLFGGGQAPGGFPMVQTVPLKVTPVKYNQPQILPRRR